MRESKLKYVLLGLLALLLSACGSDPVLNWAPTLDLSGYPFSVSLYSTLVEEQTAKEYRDTGKFVTNFIYLDMKDASFSSEYAKERFLNGECTLYASEFHDSNFTEGDYFNIERFVASVNSGTQELAVVHDVVRNKKYYLPKDLCTRYFRKDITRYFSNLYGQRGLKVRVLAYADGKPVVVQIYNPRNGGRILLVSIPLFLSDYSMAFADRSNVSLAIEMARWAGFSRKKAKDPDHLQAVNFYNPTSYEDYYDYYSGKYSYQMPVHRLQSSHKSGSGYEEGKDLMRDFLEEIVKILLYVLLVVLVCLLFRRKQRIIPVFEGYRNRTAEYVRQVALLYYADGDFATILRNRVVYFFAEVKDRQHLQLSDGDHIAENAALLASALGVGLRLDGFVRSCNLALDKRLKVDKKLLADMCEKMNAISRKLKGEASQNDLMELFK